MKLTLFLISFFALSLSAQESKPKFFQQLYLEPNVGGGLFHTIENNKYETPSNYPTINGSLGLNFRNSYVKTGIDFNYFFPLSMPSLRFQTSVNFHQLLSEKPSEHFYFGPLLGIGYYEDNKAKGYPYITLGLDSYFHNFHFALKVDHMIPRGYLHYLKTANYIHLELGYAIHLGKKKNKTQE